MFKINYLGRPKNGPNQGSYATTIQANQDGFGLLRSLQSQDGDVSRFDRSVCGQTRSCPRFALVFKAYV